jgi:hypothetical protein
MPKKSATATTEETRKRGRPRNRYSNKAEKDLHIMKIINRHAMFRNHREWRKIILEAKAYT